MIRAFTQTIDAGMDLLEAEGRLARLHLLRVLSMGALLLVSALMGAAGVIGLALGVVLFLQQFIGLPLALMSVSAPLVATAGWIVWRVVSHASA